jgi:hypothetical protein
VWADLLVTLLPDPPAGAPALVTITNTSPLTAGQVGVAGQQRVERVIFPGLAPLSGK